MKLVLDTKDLTDGFFEETKLLGIMAPMKDYQFCWQLNNLLNIDFRVNHELEIQLKKKDRNYFFAVYEFAKRLHIGFHRGDLVRSNIGDHITRFQTCFLTWAVFTHAVDPETLTTESVVRHDPQGNVETRTGGGLCFPGFGKCQP